MLQKKVKALLLIILMLLTIIGSTGCWDRAELEDQAFVIIMGIDKGKHEGNKKVTVMIAIPSKIAGGPSGGGGGGGKQEESVSTVTMEVPSIAGGVNTMNSFVSRRMNLQHMKLLVIGEELAKEGVQDTLGAFSRNREIRRSMSIAIGRPSAEKFVKALQPKLGTSPSKYVEDILIMMDATGAMPKAFYHTFLINYQSFGDEPFALLGSARKQAKQTDQKGGQEGSEGQGQEAEGQQEVPEIRAKAKTDIPGKGDPSRQAGINVDLPGTAVFRADKLVGEINGDETRIFNMIRGDFRRAIMTFREPINQDKIAVIDMLQGSPPNVKVKIKEGKPFIDVKLSLEGDLVGFQSLNNYAEDDQKRKLLERMVAGNINERATGLIKKAQEQFDTDIFGFGDKAARQKFLTWQEWSNYRWKQRFKDAEVNVIVKFAIRRVGLSFGPTKPAR